MTHFSKMYINISLTLILTFLTQRFNTTQTVASHWAHTWARSIHLPLSQSISIKSIFSSTLTSSKWSLSLSSPTKILYVFPVFPMCVTCPGHLILLHLITPTLQGAEYKLQSSLICISCITCFMSGQGTLPSTTPPIYALPWLTI